MSMESAPTFKPLPKFSMGVGDRFGQEGVGQLRGLKKAADAGFPFTPVWNKSNREHVIIGTKPEDTRKAADAAVAKFGWTAPYFVDADHISMPNVAGFIACSDFFTIDVAAHIGKPAEEAKMKEFVEANAEAAAKGIQIPGIERSFVLSREELESIAHRFLRATQAAGETYRTIVAGRHGAPFAVEVSMDEVPSPQTPPEVYFIAKMLAHEGVPIQTLAPRFSGRFNKGVEYVGNPLAFAKEFEEDAYVLAHAAREFGLPKELKLSVHSGSDKFSIYPHIGAALRKTGRGVHVKTAGTTWLEECVGIAMSGDAESIDLVREICITSLGRITELCAPYADVIDIDPKKLPTAEELRAWEGPRIAAAIRHDQTCEHYNPSLRQLVHVGYKVAAELGPRYFTALAKCRESVEKSVSENIYDRHLARLIKGMTGK